jgi:glycosyltransferase involved in cell wall biosynthesis
VTAATWHIVTCEYPPQIGGVSDHSFIVAAELAAAGYDVHVWCPAAHGSPVSTPGVTVHPSLGRLSIGDLRQTGRLLNQFASPRRILVQWVPHGYGYRSLNVPFAVWLAARARAGDRIELNVHEPYLALSAHPLHLAAALIHRLMLAIAAASAQRIWMSTPSWAPALRPYVSRRTSIEWLPVPASVLPRGNSSGVVDARRQSGREQRLVVGHFGSYSPLITDLLQPALLRLLRASDARVVLLGRGGDEFRARLLQTAPEFMNRVTATGALESTALSEHIQACDLMLQPYPDGVSARRTTAISLLAHARPIVTNAGRLSETMWRETNAVELVDRPDADLLGSRTVALLGDEIGRARLATAAREFHQRVFDVRHTIAALTGTDRLASAALPEAAAR